MLTDYESAWQVQDAARLAELFVEDGCVLSSGHRPVRGRSALREFYTCTGGPLALGADGRRRRVSDMNNGNT